MFTPILRNIPIWPALTCFKWVSYSWFKHHLDEHPDNNMQTNKRCFTSQKTTSQNKMSHHLFLQNMKKPHDTFDVFSGPGRQHHRCDGAIRSVTQLNGPLKQEFLRPHWLSSRICFKPLWCLSQWCTTRTFIQKYYVAGVHDTCPVCLPRCSCVQQHLVATVSFTGTLGRFCYHLTQLGYSECPSSRFLTSKIGCKISRLHYCYYIHRVCRIFY